MKQHAFLLFVVVFLLVACLPNASAPVALQPSLASTSTVLPISTSEPTSTATPTHEVPPTATATPPPTATATPHLEPTPTLEPRIVKNDDLNWLGNIQPNNYQCARIAVRLEKGIDIDDLLAITGNCYNLGSSDQNKRLYMIAADSLEQTNHWTPDTSVDPNHLPENAVVNLYLQVNKQSASNSHFTVVGTPTATPSPRELTAADVGLVWNPAVDSLPGECW